MVKFSKVNHSDCVNMCQVGGVRSLCPLNHGYCDLDSDCRVNKYVPKKKSKLALGDFKEEGDTDVLGFLSLIVDDGSPLKNEFLMKIEVATEKLESKKRDLLQDYKEKSYKEFVDDLKEASDDVFDSKGDDISEKDYLENEMDGALHD
jgi:hypothetical protein